MRVCFRGYIQGKLVFEERMDARQDADIEAAAKRHVALLGVRPHMIEIEFLDQPDPMKRFFRFGTETSRMVLPTAIDISKRSN